MKLLFHGSYPKAGKASQMLAIVVLLVVVFAVPALAAEDMWTVARRIIKDVYTQIAGISTVLAGLMSAVAVIGAKLSNNQHKTDSAWDWRATCS